MMFLVKLMLFCLVSVTKSTPIINTTYGLVQGLSAFNNRIFQFLSIPYAAPPINNLRWKPPQKHNSWNYTFNATREPWGCPQNCNSGGIKNLCPNYTNEDCLILNIVTPSSIEINNNNNNNNKYPVMIYIHGGIFVENYGGL